MFLFSELASFRNFSEFMKIFIGFCQNYPMFSSWLNFFVMINFHNFGVKLKRKCNY